MEMRKSYLAYGIGAAVLVVAVALVFVGIGSMESEEQGVRGTYTYTIEEVGPEELGTMIYPWSNGRVAIEDPASVEDWGQHYRLHSATGGIIAGRDPPDTLHWIRLTITLSGVSDGTTVYAEDFRLVGERMV